MRRVQCIGFTLLCAAVSLFCGVEDEPLEVDPTLFIRSFCEARCDSTLECRPELVEDLRSCLEECAEGKRAQLDHDPCFEEVAEWNRCRMDQLTCDELFDVDLPMTPGTPCVRWYEEASDCSRRS